MNAARRAAQIEGRLRAEGVDPKLIPGIIGAAFMAALLNLPPLERLAVIRAHLEAVREIYAAVIGGAQ